MGTKNYTFGFLRLSQILILFGSFLVMMVVLAVVMPLLSPFIPSARDQALTIAALQAILVFVLPAFVAAYYRGEKPISSLSLGNPPTWKGIGGVILVFILGMPFLNQTIYWNSQLSLPESMFALETAMREMEKQAMQTTEILLSARTLGGMLAGVLIIGLLTGFGEELFFRGAFQKILGEGSKKKWIAVWISALVFSAMHFQFYGFIPRLLLGAFFGYLLVWSKTIWLPVIAHAIDNSSVIVTSWICGENKADTNSIEMWGVSDAGFPLMATISAILTIGLLIYGHRFLFTGKSR